jgi:hypothetical protein
VAVRVTAWLFVVCAALGALGTVLPSFELEVRGVSLGRRASLSLYQAHQDRDFVRRMLAAYRRSSHHRDLEDLTGAKLPAAVRKAHLDDAHDAMTSLDTISDDDVRTADRVLAIVIWAFVALQVITAGLVFAGNVRGAHRRGQLIAAVALAVVTAAVAIAIQVACREAVFEANDDLGYAAISLAVGAYVIPIASIGTVIAGAFVLRASARTRSA